MIAVFARLKLRLILNGTRQSSRLVGFVLSVVGGLIGAVVLFGVLASQGRLASTGDAGDLAVVATASVFFGWVLASVFLVGVDESVDVRRLILLPLDRRQLHTGLAVAGLVGVGPLAVALGLSGLVAGYAPLSPTALLVVAAAVVAVVMPMVASRALATFLAGTLRNRWLKDVTMVVGAVLPMAGYIVPTVLGNADVSTLDAYGPAADVLRYTPGGLTGQAVASAQAGEPLVGLAALAGAVIWTAAFAWAWVASVDRLISEPELGAVGPARAREGATRAFGWPRPTPTGAVRARELRYLVRAPNRRAVLVTFPILVAVLAGSQLFMGEGTGTYSAVVALVFISASQLSNQLGYHSGGLWLEVHAASSPRELLVGRHAAWYVTAAVPVVVLWPVIGLVTGNWRATTLLLLGYLAMTPVLVAAGSVASVTAAYSVPEDTNPFRNRNVSPGQGCIAGLVSLVVTLGAALAVAPVAALVIWAASRSYPLGFAVLPVLVAYSWGLRTLAIAFAVRRFAARHDRLIETLCLTRGN